MIKGSLNRSALSSLSRDPLVATVQVEFELPDTPTNSVAPVISGVGYTGKTLTATAGTWDIGTATGQWYAEAVAISGATSSTYVVTAANHGSAFTYRETNGGSTAVSNEIHHAILTDIAGVEFWIDRLSGSYTSVANSASQINDISGYGRNATQATGALQPTDNESLNGTDAFGFSGSRVTISGLPTTGVMNYFVVAKHTGASTSSSIWGEPSGGSATYIPLATSGNTNSLLSRVSDTWNPGNTEFRLNGEPSESASNRGDIYLKLTQGGVIAAVHSVPVSGGTVLLGESSTGISFDGPIVSACIFSGTLTEADIDKITGILAWSSGESLVSGHLYESAPPNA